VSTSPDCGRVLGIIALSLPLAAMAIDDAFLAREPVPTGAPTSVSWTPTLRFQPGLALLGVGASF
jgi:hypothetical protein